MSVHETVAKRDSVHGPFVQTANKAQQLKYSIRSGANYENLSVVQRESLDMIASKIARILSGDPNEPDHWHDIAGYAVLAENEICKI